MTNVNPMQPSTSYHAEVYSKPCQASTMELFAKITDSLQRLTISAKSSVLDVLQDSEYTPVMSGSS